MTGILGAGPTSNFQVQSSMALLDNYPEGLIANVPHINYTLSESFLRFLICLYTWEKGSHQGALYPRVYCFHELCVYWLAASWYQVNNNTST